MNKKIVSSVFTDKEVTDFRRLCKVYNYKSINVERDMFEDGIVKLTIHLKAQTGTDDRNLGNIARLTKSTRVTNPDNKYLKVTFTKKLQKK